MSTMQPSRLPRVVIDVEKLRNIHSGLGLFSLSLARELLNQHPQTIHPVLLARPGIQQHFEGQSFETIEVKVWRKEEISKYIRPMVRPFFGKPKYDLWHVTNQMSKYMPLDPRVPVVLTIHDLILLDVGGPAKVLRQRSSLQAKIDRASVVTTDSQHVADEVMSRFDLGNRSLRVVHLGLSKPCQASQERPGFLDPGPFLFSIGNMLPHKNFHVLIEFVLRMPNLRIVIAGKKDTTYGEFVRREVKQRGLVDRIICPGEVSDSIRQWLYEHCDAFLCPSIAEGFGFPVLEAMQCGKPVFLSKQTSLPEIGGDVSFYWDSFNPDSMASVFQNGMHVFQSERGYAQKLCNHAANFSWSNTCKNYLRVYKEALDGNFHHEPSENIKKAEVSGS